MNAAPVVVAIDGPAGSGKSTLARRLAGALGLAYVNTGLMYRALTARALASEVDPDDGPSLAALASSLVFDVDGGDGPPALRIRGVEGCPALDSEEVERTVSRVARHPEVRTLMREEQRRLGRTGAVLEGRDIGSVVFPDATVKVFLEAEVSERIRRRAKEREADDRALGESLASRDRQDSRVNPFVPAPDAVVIDTTRLDADAAFEAALAAVRSRIGGPP